jgi:hypothetical protein
MGAHAMKLLTAAIERKLRANSKLPASKKADLKPALKLFNPAGAATWLITELDDDGIMFGLCDLGLGEAELGNVSLAELSEFRGRFGLGIERDAWFKPNKTLAEYADSARLVGRIEA